MMQGHIVGQQARIEVTFLLTGAPDKSIEFVIDTGFEGALTLPPAGIAALGLPMEQTISAKLADGSETEVDVYRGRVLWHTTEVSVAILAMDSQPLLGTALLHGNRVTADWTDGGEIHIEVRS